MRIARYADRLYVEISDSEYIAAHRRFSEGNTARLRVSVSVSSKDQWISVQIEPPYSERGNVLFRVSSGWGVSFNNKTPGLESLEVFALGDVGKFDPDDTGLDLVPFPKQLKRPIARTEETASLYVGKEVVLNQTPEVSPQVKKKKTQEETLEQLRLAAKILNKGIDSGYRPKYSEDGKIIKISLPDLEL